VHSTVDACIKALRTAISEFPEAARARAAARETFIVWRIDKHERFTKVHQTTKADDAMKWIAQRESGKYYFERGNRWPTDRHV
jgi:hypothetical protein